jgi:dolichyl-phosphate-mannose-protein mannosyltransferase
MAPIVIAVLSFWLRIWHLGTPKSYVFDEVYYAKGAKELLRYGVEYTGSSPEFIVHPPVGKWCIALGIKLFGNNEFGWRISSAIVGAILIYLVALIAQHLFNSNALSALAALLTALDGLELVHSRTALLDLFLTLFIVLALYTLLKERYWLAGIFFGLAIGTKWNGLYFLVAFSPFVIYRDYLRSRWDDGRRFLGTLLTRFAQFFLVPIGVYIASWTGWFISPHGWDRHWAQNHSSSWGFIPAPFRSLWHYHAEILNFHTTLTTHHPYQANPWSWLVMGRPTSFFYESPKTCGAKACAQEVLALGTPILWWLGTFAIAVVLGFWIRSVAKSETDRVAGFILLAIAAGYVPWFLFQKRTMFSFYAIAFEPFLILALVYCAKLILGQEPWPRNRKLIVVFIVLLIAANFIYFLPILTGSVITYNSWYHHMWLPSWI